MYARVVRFTDVTPDGIAKVLAEVEGGDGPEGVAIKRMQLLHDAEQGTALFVAFFDSAEDVQTAEEVFGAMDPADTPGSRASVDRCEVLADEQV